MATKVFISYRRDDSAAHAGRVNDRLEREFGRESLFMDVDGIPLGMDFVEVLGAEVAKCSVFLAIIGPNWLEAHDEEGNRRLDSEQDFVRIEIAAALKRSIPVIPILLEGTRVPKAEQLPDDLKSLARRNGLDVRHASFHSDMDKLVRALRGTSTPDPTRPPAGLDEVKPRIIALMTTDDEVVPEVLEAGPAERRPDTAGLREGGSCSTPDRRIKVDTPICHGAPDGWFEPGAGKIEWFQDHELGPEMVVVPAGEFALGSSPAAIAALKEEFSSDWYDCEAPQHIVRIMAPFAVGRFAVTFDDWEACARDGGCKGYRPDDQGWGRGRRPVINVSWNDAKAYVQWLSQKTGKTYRLLTEAEWGYAARAGTTTAFWWGDTISPAQANYDGNYTFAGSPKGEFREKTVPVDTFAPNPWGLFNVHGNVWEWCEDTWHGSYEGAPTDGSAWFHGAEAGPRVVRGGSWINTPQGLRATSRDAFEIDERDYGLGFRVARALTP